MTTINKIKNTLFGVALLSSLSLPASASMMSGRETSGTTDLSASIPEFIILHYYSSIALNFDTPDTEALDEGSNSMKVTWAGETSGDEKLDPANLMNAKLMGDKAKTTVKLNDVWAVRGFSKSGNAWVSVSLPNDTMSLKESVIGMSNALVSDGTSTEGTISTPLNGITKGNATIGDVQMDLDFSKTNLAGNHAGGKYMITATTY
jgi:hypothetical protein